MLLEFEKQEIDFNVTECPNCQMNEVESIISELVSESDIEEAIDYAFYNVKICEFCRKDELDDLKRM